MSRRRLKGVLVLAALLGTLTIGMTPGLALGNGFAARASVAPHIQYVGDSVGVTYTLSVKNSGTVRTLGAVRLTRPTAFWTVTSCPTAPAGWSKTALADSCTYTSAAGTTDDIAVGQAATFTFIATTAAANANRTGTWAVAVSTGSDFSNSSWIKQAGAMKTGLKTKAYSFELTAAVVADSPSAVGAACPASNTEAPAGATGKVMVVCGINHTNIAQLPKQAYSSLSGSFIGAPGSFTSAPVSAGPSSVVLGNWSSVVLANGAGTGKSVVARVGGTYSGRTSPLTTFSGYTLDNLAPVANDDPSYSTDEDTLLNASSVLANDTDANNDSLTAVQDSGPSNAQSFTLNSDGTFTYTPDANFNGSDSFTYHAFDGSLASNSATVTITINSVNDAPVATDDPSYSTDEDTPLTASSSVLTNDTDADNDSLTAVQDSSPSHAQSFTLNSDGTFSYTPNADYNGTDSFTYHAFDGSLSSNIATVTITVNAVNDPPTASNSSFQMNKNTTANSVAPGVLADASDVDSGSLTAVLVSGPANAHSFTLNADGSFSYQPNAGYIGGDSFTWKAYDGSLYSNDATVTITVNDTGGGGGGGGGGGCLIVC